MMTQKQIDRIADDVRGYLRLHPDAKASWVWRFGHDVGRDGAGSRTDVMNGTATFTLKVNGGAVDNGYTEEEKALLDAMEAYPEGFEDEEAPESATEATRFKYDSRHDTLHVFYDSGWSGWSADTTEPAPGVFVRLDDQDRPVGATILGYSERDKADLERLVPFAVDWPDVGDKEGRA